MNNAIKTSLLMVLALVVLTACQEGNKITALDVSQPAENEAVQTVDVKGAVSGDLIDLPAWEGSRVEPGYIFVANDAQNLYVSYYLSENWQLAGLDLNIARSEAEIPADWQGLPQPEKFRYKATLSQCESVYTQVIPLAELDLAPGDDFVLVSRAMVGGNGPLDHTSQPFNLCVPGKADHQWWQFGQGRVKTDPNAPDRMQKISLRELKGSVSVL